MGEPNGQEQTPKTDNQHRYCYAMPYTLTHSEYPLAEKQAGFFVSR